MKPADESLRAAVLQRLAALAELAEQGPTESQLPLARTELHRLADGWRMLLAVHQPGPDGRCRAARPRARRAAGDTEARLSTSREHGTGE